MTDIIDVSYVQIPSSESSPVQLCYQGDHDLNDHVLTVHFRHTESLAPRPNEGVPV